MQGPIVMESALQLDLQALELDPQNEALLLKDRGRLILAMCYGDQTTNMIQPFWILPILAMNKEVSFRKVALLTGPMVFVAMAVFLTFLLAVPSGGA